MKLTSFFSLKKPETTDPVNVDDFNDNFDKIDEKLHKLEENTGDMSNGKVFATITESRESIASGDTVGTITSKLMRWLKDLKGAAWKDVANNDITGADGYVADARVVKAHGDEIDAISEKVGDLYFGTNADGKGGYRTSKNGTFVPFRNPTGNADTSDVLSGKTFSSATKENAIGAIPIKGAWVGETTGDGNVAIPAGYHNGGGYVSGVGAYNKGVSDADGRVNTSSASYNTGYANGYTAGRSSARTLKGKIEGIAQNLDSGLWSRFDVYLTDDDGNDNLVVRMMGTGTQNFELEITDSMWSD